MATVGVIANPAAGKDIRRLVAHAAPISDQAKIGLVRRLLVGAIEGGATELVVAPDARHLAERALAEIDSAGVRADVLDMAVSGTRADTVAAAEALTGRADVVVALGGDGTCRDVATGWPTAPLIAVSTGTNNVFPTAVEPTIAGLAAGLVATGAVPVDAAGRQAKVVHLDIDGHADLALVEVAVLDGHSTGSRAVWDARSVRAVLAAIAEPDAVGLSAIAAALAPCGRHDDGAVLVCVGAGDTRVRVPLVPGRFDDFYALGLTHLPEGVAHDLHGPGLVAVDGERTHLLHAGSTCRALVRRDGPTVIDVRQALTHAATQGRIRLPG